MVLNRRILMLSVRLAFGYCFTGFKTDAFKEWRGINAVHQIFDQT